MTALAERTLAIPEYAADPVAHRGHLHELLQAAGVRVGDQVAAFSFDSDLRAALSFSDGGHEVLLIGELPKPADDTQPAFWLDSLRARANVMLIERQPTADDVAKLEGKWHFKVDAPEGEPRSILAVRRPVTLTAGTLGRRVLAA